MTPDERQELIAAVQEALVPFKEELKTELKAEIKEELLEPMETRLRDDLRGEMGEMETRLRGEMGKMEAGLRGEMGEMETRLRDDFGSRMDNLQTEINQMRDDFGGRLDNLETETRSIVKDVIRPFIEAAESRHSELVGRLDRLESQVEHNRQKINQVFFKMDMQEKRLYNISDDLAVVRKHIDRLDQFLIGDRTYDLAETQLMMAEGHSLYNVIQDLEKRVSLLEAYAAGMDGGIN
jgi:hypothetical protein